MTRKKWNNLLSPSNQIDDIQNKLIKIDLIVDSNFNNITDIGLLTGLSGICLYKYFMFDYFKDDKYLSDVVFIINKIFDNINSSNKISCSYAEGISGVGLLFNFLSDKKVLELDLDEIKAEFNPIIEDEFISCIKNKNFDFLHGAIGLGYYIKKNFEKEKCDDLLNKLSQSIIDSTERKVNGRTFQKKEFYFEHEFIGTNLGLAHGLPSIILFLNEISNLHINREEINICISDFILFIKNVENTNSNKLSIFSNFVTDSKIFTGTDSSLAWCYGDLGIAIALLQVAKNNNDTDLFNYAVSILKHSTKRLPKTNEIIPNPFFCHGSAGILHIFNKAYHYTDIEEFKEASRYWLNYTLKYLNSEEYIQKHINNSNGIELLNGVTGTVSSPENSTCIINLIQKIKTEDESIRWIVGLKNIDMYLNLFSRSSKSHF